MPTLALQKSRFSRGRRPSRRASPSNSSAKRSTDALKRMADSSNSAPPANRKASQELMYRSVLSFECRNDLIEPAAQRLSHVCVAHASPPFG